MVDDSRQIKLGAIISYFAIGFNIAIGLIYTPWMVENIGQNNYGLYTMANSLISMFLIDFGISAAVTRFISKYNAENNQKKVNDFLGLVYKLYFAISGVISIVLIIFFFLIEFFYGKLSIEELSTLKILYIIVAVYSVVSFPFITFNGILKAYEKFVIVKVCDMVNKVMSIALTILIIIFGGGVCGLVFVQAFSGLFTLFIKFYAIKRTLPVKMNFSYRSREMLRDIWGFSAWSTVTNISQRLILNIMPSLIGALAGAAEVAIFGVASTIEGYYFTFANAINGFFLPKISRILQKDNKEENLLNLMIRIGRIHIYILGLILVGFISVGSDFIVLWMGEKYKAAYISGILLILPGFISWPQQIASTALVAKNKMKEQAIINVIASVISLCIGSAGIVLCGSIGASFGIFMAYMFRIYCTNIVYIRSLEIDLKRFFSETFLKQGQYILLVLVAFYFASSVIHIKDWTSFFIVVSMICGCYSIVMYVFSFNQSEKALVKGLFKRLIRR